VAQTRPEALIDREAAHLEQQLIYALAERLSAAPVDEELFAHRHRNILARFEGLLQMQPLLRVAEICHGEIHRPIDAFENVTCPVAYRHYRAAISHYKLQCLEQDFKADTDTRRRRRFLNGFKWWGKSMARQKGSQTGRCQGCNHLERMRIERLVAAGASIKGTARKFEIDYHALRRHWINHVSAEVRAAYITGAGATKDRLEIVVADESLSLIDHYRIVRGALYKSFATATEVGDSNSLALLAGRLHENFRDCGRLTGELQRGPLLNIQNNVLVNPDYTKAIAQIVSAVAPYPEAREAVVAALRDLDAASTPARTIEDHRGKGVLNDG
jgi:hypothetical protein